MTLPNLREKKKNEAEQIIFSGKNGIVDFIAQQDALKESNQIDTSNFLMFFLNIQKLKIIFLLVEI